LAKWRINGIILVAIGAALWGMDSVFLVDLLKYFTSIEIILFEHILLALFSVPILWLGRHQLRGLGWKGWGALLFISWGGSAIASIIFTEAFLYGNASVVLILQKLQPIFAIFLAKWILKEKLPRHFQWFLLVALIGTYLLTFGFSVPTGLSDFRIIGSLLAIGAAVLWGGSTVMGRLLLNHMKFETVTAARFFMALPLLFAMVLFANPNWTQLGQHIIIPVAFLNVLFQALFPSLISLLLYYKGLSTTKASYATIAELAFPATGLILNWIVLHQGLTWGQFTGFAIVWFVVFQIARYQDREVSSFAYPEVVADVSLKG
jgi:drug/metabolite transporter (DMT)-like permease